MLSDYERITKGFHFVYLPSTMQPSNLPQTIHAGCHPALRHCQTMNLSLKGRCSRDTKLSAFCYNPPCLSSTSSASCRLSGATYPGSGWSRSPSQWVLRLGFFSPVVSLFLTSRFTRAANTRSCSSMNRRTVSGSCGSSSRSAQDMALTTMSSWSVSRRRQTARVRRVSPRPPCDRILSATVLTRAARRHQRSGERAHLRIKVSPTRSSRHAGPDRVRAKLSTDPSY